MKHLYKIIPALIFIGAVQAQSTPNVVIVYADDMGYGDVSYGDTNAKIQTPNIDKLSDNGMRFFDGHSSSGICTPSRFAMLTGQHHWRRFHSIVNSFGETVFRPDDFTLAKMFKSKGYNTSAIGKWHLGWNWKSLKKADAKPEIFERNGKKQQVLGPEDFDWSKPIPDGPLAQGFDYYFGDGTINFPPYCWVENDRVVQAPNSLLTNTDVFKEIPEGNWEFRYGPMVEGWDPFEVLPTLTDKAVAWINKQSKDKPFFMYFALPSPHAPIIPSDEFRGKSKAGAYGDYVIQSDDSLGRVVQALKDKGLYENTIIVFSADNGPENYIYARQKNYDHWSSQPFRGGKRDLYEGGHHVPFVISWNGVIAPKSVCYDVVSQVDLAATFANIIGYDLKKTDAQDSHNMLPILKGDNYQKPLHKAMVQNTSKGKYALRQGDWVYIATKSGYNNNGQNRWIPNGQTATGEGTKGLLYNLKDDISQAHNLYTQYPEKVAQMDSLLKEYTGGKPCAPHAQ